MENQSIQIGGLAPYTNEVIGNLGARIAAEIASSFKSRIEDVVDRRLESLLQEVDISCLFKEHVKSLIDFEISRRLDDGLLEDRLQVLINERLNDEVLLKHIDAELKKRVDVLLKLRLADDRLKIHISAVIERKLTDTLIKQQVSEAISEKLDAEFLDSAMDRSLNDARVDAALARRFQETFEEERVEETALNTEGPLLYANPSPPQFIPFDPEKESSSMYELRLDMSLKTAGITRDADKKRAFLASASADLRAFLAAAVSPRIITADDVSFSNVVTAYLRLTFDQEERRAAYADLRKSEQEGRSVASWLEELRRLAWRCRFRSKTEADVEIKKQLIRGSRLKDYLEEDDPRSLAEIAEALEKQFREVRRRGPGRPPKHRGNWDSKNRYSNRR